MNRDVLKNVFLIIMVTLCAVLLLLTGAALWHKMSLDDYKGIMEILGIPTLIGMIVTSFIHANISNNETGGPDAKKTVITSTVASIAPASAGPDANDGTIK